MSDFETVPIGTQRTLQELRGKYNELLLAVQKVIPGETRHETALRYLKQAEQQDNAPQAGDAR